METLVSRECLLGGVVEVARSRLGLARRASDRRIGAGILGAQIAEACEILVKLFDALSRRAWGESHLGRKTDRTTVGHLALPLD